MAQKVRFAEFVDLHSVEQGTGEVGDSREMHDDSLFQPVEVGGPQNRLDRPLSVSIRVKMLLLVLVSALAVMNMLLFRSLVAGPVEEHVVTIGYTALICKVFTLTLSVVAGSFASAWFGDSSVQSLGAFKRVRNECRSIIIQDILWMVLPSALMVFHENLLLLGLSHLTFGLYKVIIQSRTLFTAFWLIFLVGVQLSLAQFAAILLFSVGSIVAEIANESNYESLPSETEKIFPVGVLAVFGVTIVATFTSVYYERILKSPAFDTSIFVRLSQLALLSFGFDLVSKIAISSSSMTVTLSAFSLNSLTCLTGLSNAVFLLVVTVLLKVSTNLHLCAALALAGIFATGLSVLLFKASVSFLFDIGAFLVFAGTFLFATSSTAEDESDGYAVIGQASSSTFDAVVQEKHVLKRQNLLGSLVFVAISFVLFFAAKSSS